MKWKKWGKVKKEEIVKDEIIRLKLSQPYSRSLDGYIYGRCTGRGFGCSKSPFGRAIFVENTAWTYKECKDRISKNRARWNRDLDKIEVMVTE